MKKERKYNGLRKSAEQSPVSTMLIVLLLAAGIFLFPVEDMMRLFTGRYGLTEELAGTMAVRYLFAAVIVKLAYDFGFERLYLWSPFGKGALYALPFLLVAINNAPIIGLATGNASVTAGAGDIVLYQGNQIVLFYGSNSWSYTRLGRIDDLTGWTEALGSGDVSVTFSLGG